MIALIFLIVALVLFALAALGVPDAPRFKLIAGGLFFWALSTVVSGGLAIHIR
jgi:hypothetical protein